ncbi:MAG TPA: tetratricopeptide repeat protein [Kofleriaceae bacterium]|jgi:Tfp pilus assembly protein PilF|nr:tetratricopeptide repeat protein [Kofleriaceae bacterium]
MSREAACERARELPGDLDAQRAAAYACDSDGFEADAIGYYDAAYRLGAREPEFLVGYGSTLKNVGRLEDSLAILGQAEADPTVARAARAFRALTLHRAGRSDAAVALLVRLVAATGVARYRPALESYAEELER